MKSKSPIDITVEGIADEVAKVQAKLGASLGTLRNVENFDYGASEKQEVWRDGKVVLYRYTPVRKTLSRVPILVSYALVNRPYMIDLQDNRSLVKGLLDRGEDVYVIDWGYTDRSDKFLTLEDYIQRFLDGAVDFLRARHKVDAVNVLGICQGGVFSLCYAALNPSKVKNLITMVTPVDFQTPDNMLSNWTRELDVDLFVDTMGNIPADVMNYSYLMLKPFRLNMQKYVGMVDIMDNPEAMTDFLRMEKWIFDSPDQAGEAFRQFVKFFYQGNGFVNKDVDIGDRPVDLDDVTMPVLNIYAEQDHLVPPDASRRMKELVGTRDYTELSFKGGHIGIYVSSRAQKEVPDTIHHWLSQRSV